MGFDTFLRSNQRWTVVMMSDELMSWCVERVHAGLLSGQRGHRGLPN